MLAPFCNAGGVCSRPTARFTVLPSQIAILRLRLGCVVCDTVNGLYVLKSTPLILRHSPDSLRVLALYISIFQEYFEAVR